MLFGRMWIGGADLGAAGPWAREGEGGVEDILLWFCFWACARLPRGLVVGGLRRSMYGGWMGSEMRIEG